MKRVIYIQIFLIIYYVVSANAQHVASEPIQIVRGSSGQSSFITADHDPWIWSTQNIQSLSYPFGDVDLGHLVIQPRTSAPRDILFVTGDGNDIRLAIKGDGRIGIGTTGPNAKFEVIGQDVNFYSNAATNTFNIGRNANEMFKFYITDNSGYLDYMQDSDDNSTHSLCIRNLAGGTSANNDIRFHAGGYDRLSIRPDGNVGIGTMGPAFKLHIITGSNGDRAISFSNSSNYISSNSTLLYTTSGSGTGIFQDAGNLLIQPRSNATRGIYLNTYDGSVIDTRMAIKADGNVGIGTTSPYYKLDVEGTIRAHEIKVNLNTGADFVFEENYNLMPLNELEAFVKTQKHLPEVAPAKEMEAEGLSISEMNIKLLQKIEELTLYVIDIDKELKSVKEENKILQEKINVLETKKQ